MDPPFKNMVPGEPGGSNQMPDNINKRIESFVRVGTLMDSLIKACFACQ